MEKIKFGIVGTGTIAHRFAEAIKNVPEAELVAVASRKEETGKAFAEEFGIPHVIVTYEAMAASPLIDAAYIGLPHSYHCPVSCMMMRGGKHVLCEKPLAVTRREAEQMFATAKENRVFLMEAMWGRLVPGTQKLLSLVNEGVLGEILGVEGKFCYQMDEDEMGHHVFKNENGGGSLLDVGVYGLSFAKWYLGTDIISTAAQANIVNNTDYHTCVQLAYANGAIAQLSSATMLRKPNEGFVYGTKGYAKINRFYAPQTIELHPNDGPVQTIETPYWGNGFEEQIAHTCRCIAEGLTESPVITPEHSLFIMGQMDAIRKEIGLTYLQDNDEGNAQ